jgi:aspartyl-tRNA(Asn)/glutamyl-tRNA(Gln) amidotransferase subunit A
VLNQYDVKDPCCSWTLHHVHSPRPLPKSSSPTDLSGLRIGIPKEYYVKELSYPTLNAWNRAIVYLESCGASCVPVSLPHTQHALSAYYVLQPSEATKSWRWFTEMRKDATVGSLLSQGKAVTTESGVTLVPTKLDGFGDEVMRRIMMGTICLGGDSPLQEALRYRRLIQQDFDNVFASPNPLYPTQASDLEQGVDVLLTPTTVSTAPLLDDVLRKRSCVDEYVNDVFTVPASLAGVPAMCVPFGMSTEDGFPLGLQLIAQYGDEERLFVVGKALEAASH